MQMSAYCPLNQKRPMLEDPVDRKSQIALGEN